VPSGLHNGEMRDAVAVPKISKWPFLLGDALLVWTACFIYIQSKLPMGFPELALACGCICVGAILAILPFVLDYRACARLAETGQLVSVVEQIQDVQKLAGQISDATGRWQFVQEESEKTVVAAKGIAERMTSEVKAFGDFMQRINDTEKATLRLEAEKLRRGETEWLQLVVRMMDHVHALHTAGVRSGQPRVIEQLTHFQNACRDVARRMGLIPFVAAPGDAFDPQKHERVEIDGKAAGPSDPGSKVSETVASGYTFQGRLLRPALVRVEQQVSDHAEDAASGSEKADPQLSLGGISGT